ncbi:NTP transferase domain-containing protein [Gluconacetobacter diazotrophicus]|uniref:NTP transferase domain-containing protein n=1 Tax=Gluconacetobacter diazotrophicus TaxID=33996 RepID=A0A7W4FDV7_GLUDI|nr:NTP transferase domain-containing protein [Gluconacetobacter diazotrophicus]MBB2155981.1 NTP transferase domain-containing protein [Gluconacetobacter diazotrophicus]
MTSGPLNVLVLAGTRAGASDPMASAAGVSHKAILPVAGRPMIARVVDALAANPRIGRIVISIETPDILAGLLDHPVEFLPPAPGPSASVMAALHTLGTPLLVTTADHALLRPEWIDAFLDSAGGTCDMAAAIAMAADITRDVPATRRTMIRLADGAFSGCNLFLFRTPAAIGVVRAWQRLEQERKHPLRMARLLGIGTLIRYLTGRLTRAALCARIGMLGHASVRLVALPDGRAAVDVDKPADLALVETILARAAA